MPREMCPRCFYPRFTAEWLKEQIEKTIADVADDYGNEPTARHLGALQGRMLYRLPSEAERLCRCVPEPVAKPRRAQSWTTCARGHRNYHVDGSPPASCATCGASMRVKALP